MPTIHTYDTRTREYLKTVDWTPPNEWVALPSDATTLQPPAQREGFARVLNLAGDVWEHVEDHRGEAGYVEGQPHTVRDLGPLPAGWSDTPPELTPEELLDKQLAAIEAKYEAVFGRLRAAMAVAMLADGPSMDAKVTALRAEWSTASSAQSAEISALIGG